MGHVKSRGEQRKIRRSRVRKRVRGTNERPRLSVYRSLHYTYVQVISDESQRVLAALSTRQVSADGKSKQSVESAKLLGKNIAKALQEKKISTVVLDRNGYAFHGRVKAVAEGAREAGLRF